MISNENFAANGQAAQAAVDLLAKAKANCDAAKADGGNKVVGMNPTPLLNRSAVRAALLDHAKRTRAHKYTRVSEDTLLLANAHLRIWIVNHVAKLPSMGKTI